MYKPVEVISSYGHLVGDGFASALNKAVNSVFTLTAKMACKAFSSVFVTFINDPDNFLQNFGNFLSLGE